MILPGTQVLRETRSNNLAYWNLHDRDFRCDGGTDGGRRFQVDGKPLAFFHFSGYDVFDRLRLSRHNADIRSTTCHSWQRFWPGIARR